MTKAQIDHLASVMHDLTGMMYALEEEPGTRAEVNRLNTIIGKLYDLVTMDTRRQKEVAA